MYRVWSPHPHPVLRPVGVLSVPQEHFEGSFSAAQELFQCILMLTTHLSGQRLYHPGLHFAEGSNYPAVFPCPLSLISQPLRLPHWLHSGQGHVPVNHHRFLIRVIGGVSCPGSTSPCLSTGVVSPPPPEGPPPGPLCSPFQFPTQ